MSMQPKYPVYIISKGRYETTATANLMKRDSVPFKIVVEPQEADLYRKSVGEEFVEVLPFSNLGLGGIPARNWCWEHAKANGHARHWIFDDNIFGVYRRHNAVKCHCDMNIPLCHIEEFVERYENIAIAGMDYTTFVHNFNSKRSASINCRVYSNLLIDNSLPFRWRGRYNEDTDLCLQSLTRGLCTVLIHAYTIDKMATMRMKGGNTDQLYAGDGRLKMATSLARVWPGLVTVQRRWGRPHHIVKWDAFKTALKLRADAKPISSKFHERLTFVEKKPIQSQRLRKIIGKD